MKIFVAACFTGLLLNPIIACGGGETAPRGARSFGLAHASVTLEDEWALVNNIAGIHKTKHFTAFAGYQNLYGLPDLNLASFGIAFPFKEIASGINFSRFGNSYFSETIAGWGVAHRIRNVSLGFKINYHQTSIQEVSVRRNIVLEFGGQAMITEQLFFGAHIYNINQATLHKRENQFIPVLIKAGLSYRPYKKLMLNIETEKELDFKTIFKAGAEYSIIEKCRLRGGISLNPGLLFFGAGFRDKKISIDYALNSHHILGISQTISLTYIFNAK